MQFVKRVFSTVDDMYYENSTEINKVIDEYNQWIIDGCQIRDRPTLLRKIEYIRQVWTPCPDSDNVEEYDEKLEAMEDFMSTVYETFRS